MPPHSKPFYHLLSQATTTTAIIAFLLLFAPAVLSAVSINTSNGDYQPFNGSNIPDSIRPNATFLWECRNYIDPNNTLEPFDIDPLVTSIRGRLLDGEKSPCRSTFDFGGCQWIAFYGQPPYEIYAFVGPNCEGEIAWTDSGIGQTTFLRLVGVEWSSFYFTRRDKPLLGKRSTHNNNNKNKDKDKDKNKNNPTIITPSSTITPSTITPSTTTTTTITPSITIQPTISTTTTTYPPRILTIINNTYLDIWSHYELVCYAYIDPADQSEFLLADPVLTSATGTLQEGEKSPCRKTSDSGFGDCGYISFVGGPIYGFYAYRGPDCTGELYFAITGPNGRDQRTDEEWQSFQLYRRPLASISAEYNAA